MGLKYYAEMKDAPLYDLLRQASINTDNQLMDLSDSSCQDCTDTGRSTGAYIIFYQGEKKTTAHMFQDQFINKVQKVSTIQHELQEWL